jgi:predicted AAA+ superfamily ATPase
MGQSTKMSLSDMFCLRISFLLHAEESFLSIGLQVILVHIHIKYFHINSI